MILTQNYINHANPWKQTDNKPSPEPIMNQLIYLSLGAMSEIHWLIFTVFEIWLLLMYRPFMTRRISLSSTLIAKFMGPIWGPLGPVGPRWAPCWPHKPCHQGDTSVAWPNVVHIPGQLGTTVMVLSTSSMLSSIEECGPTIRFWFVFKIFTINTP